MPDRTTIRATIDELLSKLRANLVASPPTVQKPFRSVIVGAFAGIEFARPFLAIELVRARPIGTTDGDKLLEVDFGIGVITDVLGNDAHSELLDLVAAVDDYMDGLQETGVIEGADGFDGRFWAFDEPRITAGPRVARATARETFVVRVARGQN